MAVELDAVGVSRSIIIGCGGTGHRIILETRKRLVDKYGSLSKIPIVQFLQLDTTPLKEEVRYAKEVNLTPNEYVFMQVQNIAKYRRGLENEPHLYPHLASWVPRSILTTNVDQGAGQVRARGRFAFFENYPTIRERLYAAMNRVTSDQAYREATSNGIRVSEGGISVYILTSLMGGTGSGIFLDLAYLAKNELSQAAGAKTIDTIGILLLPPVGGDLVGVYSANAYASLMELNHFNNPATEFVAQYQPGMPELRDPDDPFTFCYLMDSRNEEGDVIGEDKLIQMIGHYLFLDLTHEFASKKRENRDNHKQWLRRDEFDCPTKYLSFGLSALCFPKDQVLHVCANRLAKELVSGWMDPASVFDDRQLQEEASNRMAQANWDCDRVRAGLAVEGQSQHGRSATDAVGEMVRRAEATAKQAMNESAIRALERLIQQDLPPWISAGDEANPDVRQRRGLGIYPEEIRKGLERRIEHMSAWLVELVTELVNDPKYRHEGCRRMLACLERIATQSRDRLIRDSTELKAQMDALNGQIQKMLSQSRGEIRKAMESAANGSRRKAGRGATSNRGTAEAAISSFCRAVAQHAQDSVQAFVCDAAHRFYTEMLACLAERNRDLRRYEEHVGGLRERFRAEEMRFLESSPAVNGEILYTGGDEDADEAINRYYQHVTATERRQIDDRVQAELGITSMGLYGYFLAEGAGSIDTIAGTILRHTTAAFKDDIEAVEVLNLFFERYPDDRAAEEQMKRLNRLCSPFVHAKAGGMAGFTDDPQMRQRNIGIPNAEEPKTSAERRFRAMVTKAASVTDPRTWVTVASRSEALFLHERSGFPLRLMEDALRRCESHYEHTRKRRKEPVHARVDFQQWESLTPAPPHLKAEAWKIFFIAAASGVLTCRPVEVQTQRGQEERFSYEISYFDDQGVQHTEVVADRLPPFDALRFDGRDYPNGVMQLLLKLCHPEGLTDLARRIQRKQEETVAKEGVAAIRERLLDLVNNRLSPQAEFTPHACEVVSGYLRSLQSAPGAGAPATPPAPAPAGATGDRLAKLRGLLEKRLMTASDYAAKLKEMRGEGVLTSDECRASLNELRDAGLLTPAEYDAACQALGLETAESPAEENSIEARLMKLKSLFEKGLITQEDYDAKRTAILAEI
ncbi:MAG TPA: tubulin-like doman-containing protein [Armatimonadota bacterium]|nr:tubulin-like doman-containing protein [Armatimonadota bacterium]